MAIKLADTLAPMADFPAVEAKDVAFSDTETLQEKYDNGELGGGTNITIDSAMSDISTNPVQNKIIKEYVDNKSTNVSEIDGNAIIKKSDGLFVEDLSNKVNALNIAQKTVNSELEYYYATKTTSISGVSIKDSNLINYLPYLTNITSNLEPSRYNTEGVTLKKSKTYRITFGLARAITSGNGTSVYVMDSDGNKLGNRGYFGSNSYSDNIIDVIYTPTKDISVYPALVNLNTNLGSTYYPDCSFFQITEIGREVTIDPVEYVDSTKGIEDTPVGTHLLFSGTIIPKNYILCDGSIYNIVDYPYLAQWMKDQFGKYNVFGGDGITTFAVPDKGGIYLTDPGLIQDVTKDGTPFTNIGTYSGYTLADAFTYSNNNSWFSSKNQDEFPSLKMPHIGYKFNEAKYVSKIILRNMAYSSVWRCVDYTIQGSNDGINWDELYVGTALPEDTLDHEITLTRCGYYTQYRLVFTKLPSGNTSYNWGIGKMKFLGFSMNKSIIKAEPTYYMELNQAAYINQYCDVYSTDEKIVGKWVDGKPLYRKSYEVTSPSASNSSTVLFTYSSDMEIQDIDGCILAPTETTTVNFYYSTEYYASCWSNHENKQIKMVVGNSSYTSRPAIITILYTKTTDAQNSFDYGMIIDQFAQEALVDVAVTDAEVDKCFE